MSTSGQRTTKEIVWNIVYGIFSIAFVFVLLPLIFNWLLEKFPDKTAYVAGITLFSWVIWLAVLVPVGALIVGVRYAILKRKKR